MFKKIVRYYKIANRVFLLLTIYPIYMSAMAIYLYLVDEKFRRENMSVLPPVDLMLLALTMTAMSFAQALKLITGFDAVNFDEDEMESDEEHEPTIGDVVWVLMLALSMGWWWGFFALVSLVV